MIVECGRVLLVRRRVAEGRLSWQFPAGKVEPGETSVAAAVRETFEETGLIVRAIRPLGSRVHPDTGRMMFYVACEVIEGTAFVAAPEEVAEVAWCDPTMLAGLHEPVRDYLRGHD
ncbi:NUDIX hydrolase [Actinoplanes sp. CA-142083]|uniref:NUDIX hydrolase n=1 Tax=Actinoplanes sp. CA-142083 TaxID=3239903 RepID=UPI003D8DCBF4